MKFEAYAFMVKEYAKKAAIACNLDGCEDHHVVVSVYLRRNPLNKDKQNETD